MPLLLKYTGMLLLTTVLAGLFYYTADGQSKISRVEYYFDADPGFGNATAVNITAADSIVNTSINITPASLTQGVHTLFVRASNANGVWGQDVKWVFVKPYIAGTQYTIKYAEYYIDKDPGFGNGTALSVLPGDSVANTLININATTLTQGLHTLFVRASNANGVWGQDVKYIFIKPYPTGASYAVKQVEYYIDKDPGYGKGIVLSISPADSITNSLINVDVTKLNNGQHTLFVRSRNANGTWGDDVKWLFLNNASTLPLNLLSFTGEMQHSNALLNWQTTNEINTQNFTIQRSPDGATFTPLGSVPATDEPGTNNYSFTDAKPLEGENYYRLKMFDKDGAFTYSAIILLNNGAATFALTVYPNPAGNTATLSFNSINTGKYGITVTTLDGKTLRQINGVASLGINTVVLNLAGLGKGVYMVTLKGANGKHTLKLLKGE